MDHGNGCPLGIGVRSAAVGSGPGEPGPCRPGDRPRSAQVLPTDDLRLNADAVRALPGPDWLRARREGAFERFASLPLPTDADEVWRYSRIGDLSLGSYDAPTGTAPSAALPADVRALIDAIGPRSGLAVTIDGAPVSVEAAASGVTVEWLSGRTDGADLAGEAGVVDDSLTALADAFLVDAPVITAKAGGNANPVVVVHHVTSAGLAAFPRTIVWVDRTAELSVIELHTSGDGSNLVMPISEMCVDDGGSLSYCSVQESGASTFGVAYQASRVGRDARLRSFTAALGGSYSRCRTDSRIEGQGGRTELLAAYFGTGEQMHDFRTLQEHAAPRTDSDLLFKGAVADKAQSVYSGMIRIHKGAKGSKAFQTNRNLVLSEGAHADSVPNLDIQENDVRCSHASAVGPIDPEQRYYLESRGVRPEVADRLILLGFFDDLFARIDMPGIRTHLTSRVAARLGGLRGA